MSEATESIARAFGVRCRLLPMSDDRVRTFVTTEAGELPFQEYFVQRGFQDDVRAVRFDGVEAARPAPGVIEAIENADGVIVAPSNPLVSIGPILAVPGVRHALVGARVAAISPIVGGRALKGPADRMLSGLGYEPSATGVARLYADFLDVLLLDRQDAALAEEVQSTGVRPIVTTTIMRGEASRRALGEASLRALAS